MSPDLARRTRVEGLLLSDKLFKPSSDWAQGKGGSVAVTVGNVQDEVVDGPIPPMTAFVWRKSIRSMLGDTLTGTNQLRKRLV